jgi:hypothetical protein
VIYSLASIFHRDQSTVVSEPLAPISESPGTPGLLSPSGSVVQPQHQQPLRKSVSAAALRGKDEEEEEKLLASPVFQEQPKKVKVIKPKPSELREMNFWSPTSM